MEVDVEILDVTEEEARLLLLSIDPLAALAEEQEQLPTCPRELTPPACEELQAAWQASTEAYRRIVGEDEPRKEPVPAEQWHVLMTCRDERQQVELLARFKEEGLACRAVVG